MNTSKFVKNCSIFDAACDLIHDLGLLAVLNEAALYPESTVCHMLTTIV